MRELFRWRYVPKATRFVRGTAKAPPPYAIFRNVQSDMSQSSSIPTISSLSNEQSLTVIGTLVDQAFDDNDLHLAKSALSLADELEARGLHPTEITLLDYFRANAWMACYVTNRLNNGRAAVWDFEQPEVGKQVFLLRRAKNSAGFGLLQELRRCQILTNLANQLDTLGRFVDARAQWTAALNLEPRFWMALGNRGRGLMFYAAALYDPGHAAVFAVYAYRDLRRAAELISAYPSFGEEGLRDSFMSYAEQIAANYDIQKITFALKIDDWGPMAKDAHEAAGEAEYRHWCLEKTLFLNPLNDLGAVSIAARDVLNLPDITTPVDEPPAVVGMFNELKQGFATARWLLWEGMHSTETHFSDREVLLHCTYDGATYGLATEKVKTAFRLAYSILDKIAYFVNFYLQLGIPERGVSFRSIWRDKNNGPMREYFVKSENWPFRGLFWLSKDFFEVEMRDSTEPEARSLAELRNHLEHKYVKVLDVTTPEYNTGPLNDTLAHMISRTDLEQRTLRLMQLVRSALIYLSLGVHREERNRKESYQGLVGPIPLIPLPDEWKR